MPDMDGVKLHREMNRREIGLPVLFLTAHGDIPTAVETLRSGAVDFIEKPFESEDLLERVRRAIEDDRERHEIRRALDTLESVEQ